jgi:ribose/xylose/arabinose/galactoside ABC-type transport system permease subunit
VRLFLYFLLFLVVFVVIEKLVMVVVRGDIFKPGAFKDSFRSLGKDLWLGARMFVVLWLLYLIFIWFVRNMS